MPIARTQASAPAKPNQDMGLTEYKPFASQDTIKLSVGIVQRLIAVKTKQGHNCSNEDAIKFIAMCKAKALNPFEGDAYLIGYDTQDGPKFSLITAHQAFLKRAELHAEYDGMRSGVIIAPGFDCGACEGKRIVFPPNAAPVKCPICDGAGLIDEIEGDVVPPDQELAGGWSTIYFKNRKIPMHKRIPIGPFRKPFGVWKDNPAGMIVKCSEADGLRSSFPTMLGGLYLREEIDLFPTTVTSSSAPPPSFMGPTETAKVIDMPKETTQPAEPEDAPPGAEMPAKGAESTGKAPESVQEPSSEPEPPQEPESAPQAEGSAESSPFQNFDAAAADMLKGDELLGAVQANLKSSGCTGEQLTKWARKSSLAKSDQSWSDMNEAKLRNVLKKWAVIGPTVKEIK